jgi:hypothetical protein
MIDEVALLSVFLSAAALISCLSVEKKRTIRRLPRALWVVVILLLPIAGATAWFLAGRPYALTRKAGWWFRRSRAALPRPQAPDDDTDFLQELDKSIGGDQASGPPRQPDDDDDDPTPPGHE